MTDRIETKTTTHRIKTESTARRIDPAMVAEKLGAMVVSAGPSLRQSPVALLALRRDLFARLESSGGRPALAGATRRQKIPLPEADWRQLERLSAALQSTDLRVSPGQVASMLLHTALRWVRADLGLRGRSELIDVDPNDAEGFPPRFRLEVA